MNKGSTPYKNLCSIYYDLDKPTAPVDALHCYLRYAQDAHGPILEPMCGTGRFLIPLLERGYDITGFDCSPQMLEVCRRKCADKKLPFNLLESTFETFVPAGKYSLIFIPNGSFCLLTTQQDVERALKLISSHLKPGGKFVFEVETLKAVSDPQGVWKGNWVNKPDGAKIVINTLSKFDAASRIETTLCRYELWEHNTLSCTEVECFRLKLYDTKEIEPLLERYGLTILGKWQAEPYLNAEAIEAATVILYECAKNG